MARQRPVLQRRDGAPGACTPAALRATPALHDVTQRPTCRNWAKCGQEIMPANIEAGRNRRLWKGQDMRLYRAICAALEAYAATMSEPEEFGPEGAGEARSEHAHSFSTPPELHARSDRQSLDDDDGGSYRKRRPIGFMRNP